MTDAWRKWVQECQRRGLDAPSGRNGSGEPRLRSAGTWDDVEWMNALSRVEPEQALIARGFDREAAVVLCAALGNVQSQALATGQVFPRVIEFVLDRSAEWASDEIAMAVSNPAALSMPWPVMVSAGSQSPRGWPRLVVTNLELGAGAPNAPELEVTSGSMRLARIWRGPNSRLRFLPKSGA